MAIVAPGKGAVHVRAAWDLGLLLGHPGGAARAFARGWACLSNPMCKLFLKGIQIQRLTYFEPEICNNSEEATPCTWRLSLSRDPDYSAQESTRNQAIRSCLGAPVCSRCLLCFNPLLDLLPESVKRGDRIVQMLEMWQPPAWNKANRSPVRISLQDVW